MSNPKNQQVWGCCFRYSLFYYCTIGVLKISSQLHKRKGLKNAMQKSLMIDNFYLDAGIWMRKKSTILHGCLICL